MSNTDRIKEIQRELNVTADGIIGNITLTAIEQHISDCKNETEIVPSDKMVCISIGHSTTDKGAVSSDGIYNEFDFNTPLANIIKEELKNKYNIDSKIVNRLTHGGGTGMTAATTAVNSFVSDCIIELHANSSDPVASGTETYYWNTSSNSKRLATLIQEQMVSILELPNRGIKASYTGDRGSAVLRDSHYPMALLEPFFINNDNDLKIALEHREKLGKGIALALYYYLA